MTTDAQSALRRIIEDYSHVTRFCIICNNISKILDPIRSRGVNFRFTSIPINDMYMHLLKVLQLEGITTSMNETCLRHICKLSNGDMRKGLFTLQLVSNVFQGGNMR